MPAARLYAVYERWCRNHAMEPISRIAFSRALAQAGYTKHRTRLARYWNGIRCLTVEEPQALRASLAAPISQAG